MKSLVGRGILLILPLIILFNPPVKAENNHGEEAIYSVKYLNYTNDFNVYLQGDSIFIQLEDIISFFKIYYKTNDNQRFDGYVNTRDSSYFIDFNTKEYKDISGKINLLTDDTWFATDLQVYVRTDLISKIFKKLR